MTVRWSRTRPADAEGAEYVGTYGGRTVRVTRVTDFNDDGPYYGKAVTETRWDGYVEETHPTDGRPFWSLVAECYGTRRAATKCLTQWIERNTR